MRIKSALLGGKVAAPQVAEGVIGLGQVLQADEQRQEQAGLAVGGKYGPQGDSLGDEVHHHGHKLGGPTAAPYDEPVQEEEADHAEQEDGDENRQGELRDALGGQHEGHRRHQHPAAEGDDAVRDFPSQGAIGHQSQPGQKAAEDDGYPGDERIQDYLGYIRHRHSIA
jgi:hypothetical protein